MAYDAWSLANYGVDRYTNPYPVYLINFDGGQSALYAYCTMFCIKIFGFSLWAIRLPAVFFGCLSMICIYLLAKKAKGKSFAILAMLLVAICPWEIMQSRFGLDCNLMGFFMLLAIYALASAKKTWHYLIVGVIFGITLYTYILSYIILPIFLCLTIAYLLWTKKITWKQILIMGIPIALLAIPLVLMLLVNMGLLPEIQLSFTTIPKLPLFRQGEISFRNIMENSHILENLLSKDGFEFTSIPEYGTIYYLSIPFLLFGIILQIKQWIKTHKEKQFDIGMVMLFAGISVFLCIICVKTPTIYKANAIYIPLLYFTAMGIYACIRQIHITILPIMLMYIISFILFCNSYFSILGEKDFYCFNDDLISVMEHLEKYEDKEIYFNVPVEKPYIYTLLYHPISPYEFYHSATFEDKGVLRSYKNYYFYDKGETVQNPNEEAIYITKFKQDVDLLRQMNFKEEIYEGYFIFYQ